MGPAREQAHQVHEGSPLGYPADPPPMSNRTTRNRITVRVTPHATVPATESRGVFTSLPGERGRDRPRLPPDQRPLPAVRRIRIRFGDRLAHDMVVR